MRDGPHQHVEALDLPPALPEAVERPGTPKAGCGDREERGPQHRIEGVEGITAIGREMHRDPRVGPVARSEEREALGVVPMQMGEQQ